jgi:hypothetical protein
MSKVITFSRVFPSYHPRAGDETYFVERLWKSFYSKEVGLPSNFHSFVDAYIGADLIQHSSFESNVELYDRIEPKHHTIRAGHRFKSGDWFSPRVWSGKPYNSKQIQFAPDIQVKKVYSFSIGLGAIYIDQQRWIDKSFIAKVAGNDGLEMQDFLDWFQYPKPFDGQIISWNESINY